MVYELPKIGEPIESHGLCYVYHLVQGRKTLVSVLDPNTPREERNICQDAATPMMERPIVQPFDAAPATCATCGRPFTRIKLDICPGCHHAEKQEKRQASARRFRAWQKRAKMAAVFGSRQARAGGENA
jgi:hypothetical protein